MRQQEAERKPSDKDHHLTSLERKPGRNTCLVQRSGNGCSQDKQKRDQKPRLRVLAAQAVLNWTEQH